MEKWITRAVAALVATGGLALFWVFGLFAAVPWREGRLLAMNAIELQVTGISLIAGLAVLWGTVHLFGLADRADSPRLFQAVRLGLALLAVAAIFTGAAWTEAHLAP